MLLIRKNATNLSTKRAAVAIKAGLITDEGTFEGYGSVFNSLDTYGDIVLPGAYAASLAAHRASGTRPKLLWQHDQEQPIGIWDEMIEDNFGLYCKGRLLLDVPKAREAHLLMKAGAIDGLSIGFETVAFEYLHPDDAGKRYSLPAHDFNKVRAVSQIDLWEVSVVTFQACAPAVVTAVKQRSPTASDDGFGNLVAALARRQLAISRLIGA